ncbi:MAG TPA: ShlB/FhaC/HecB family hemolysin secretion/activation protein [Gammaproteobacteria bacterium]|nr:ShlB/FhaC/HecB family hemolysin secretion/activation protein [Gammaproteobacteria bacterium]
MRGSTVYDAPTLFEVYREQLGKPVSADRARAIVAALLAKYEADGYSRPQAKLDDALLEAGVLRIDIREPRIGEVRVNGDPGPHLERLETLGTKLRDDVPITQAELASTLRQMRSLPGLTLQATTARDDASANVYRLDLDTQFDRMTGVVRLSNRGTDEAGPVFLLGQVMFNGLLGGRTNLGAVFGGATDYDEYHGLGLLAQVGVGASGGGLSFSGFRSRSDPHEPLVDRDDDYLRDRASISFARPLPGFERANLVLAAALDLDDLEILRAGERLRDERLRMLSVNPRWSWRHERGAQYLVGLEVVKGLDAMGSGLTALDIEEDARRADFTLTRMTFTRLSRFGESWSVRFDALAQQTPHVLPYAERFKIGGERLGRGFEVAEIAGDEGAGAKVELRRNLDAAPALLRGASLYGFYDLAAAFKNNQPGRESAATAGFGLAVQHRRVSSIIELAKPLTHPDVEGRKELALFAEVALLL